MTDYMLLPIELQAKVENLSPLQRKYCEYRSRGISQAECMRLAGSEAKEYKTRADMGYQVEHMDGAKEYIDYLKAARSKVMAVEDAEVIQKLRDIYLASMEAEEFRYAVQSIQLLGETIGLFNKGKGVKRQSEEPVVEADKDPEAFRGESASEKVKLLQKMMKEINKGPKDEVSYSE